MPPNYGSASLYTAIQGKQTAAKPPPPPKGIGPAKGVGRAPAPPRISGSVNASGPRVSLPRSVGKETFSTHPPELPFSGAPKLQRAYAQTPAPKSAPAQHSLLSLHTLEQIPPALSKGVADVYGSKAGTKGGVEHGRAAAGAAVASPINSRNLLAEGVNIPAQVGPALYQVGKAGVKGLAPPGTKAHEESSSEFKSLAHNYLHSTVVGNLIRGHPEAALNALTEHPIAGGLEVSGTAGAIDRGLGALGRVSGVDAAKLADGGVTSRAPREYPTSAVPEGGATVAQRPYHKGLVRPALEKRVTAKPVPAGRISPSLRKSFDRFEGEHLRITRASRDQVIHDHVKTLKGTDRQGAIVPFGQWLADPKAINPATGVKFATEHLNEAIKHFSKAPPHEFPEEAAIRKANVEHLKALQGRDLTKAYGAAQKIAADKRALEPELVKHGVYTPETIRAAKLVPAFQFHFRDQNPFVDTSAPIGESPFHLGGPEGRQIPVDEVAKKLEEKGIHEKQLSFVTTRPFQNGNAPFRSGRIPGGAKPSKGHLSGHAFIRGQFDPTPDAALRQHLTDVGIINRARGDLRFSSEYVHSREAIAKLLEKRLGTLPAGEQVALRNYIAKDLRSGSDRHFPAMKNGKSAWQQALEAREHLKALHPDIQLEPIRVAHPYATKEYRGALGSHLDTGILDPQNLGILDPANHGAEQELWKTRVPEEHASQLDPTAGPVGLVHREIRDRVRTYEKDLGAAHLSRMPASFWRKTNVAFSVRHVPGVMQEIGLRSLANNIGFLSGIRATRAAEEIMRYAEKSPDPFVKLGAQRFRAMSGGTVAANALEQAKHVTSDQMANTPLGKVAGWWQKGAARKVTGAPLRSMTWALKGFNHATNRILSFERKAIEHPPQFAGVGKHLNEEFQRMHGERLKLVGAMSDVEKSFLRGQLDPKAIDHAANMMREYWGEWTRSSPQFRKWQSVSPFLQWYLNSLRFLYHTMPVHHPITTGLLVAMEGATREQRLAEGQEYKGGFPLGSHLEPSDLEASQQGSLPFGKGFRAGQEYYTPAGAVSGGPLETTMNAVLPYASGIYDTLSGIDPITKRPLEEKNPETGKKERITDPNRLFMLGALSLAESFMPPLRYASTLERPRTGEKEDALGKALGVPPNVWQAFRPLRTETERKVKPEKEKKLKLGPKLGTSLGTSLKTNLGP